MILHLPLTFLTFSFFSLTKWKGNNTSYIFIARVYERDVAKLFHLFSILISFLFLLRG